MLLNDVERRSCACDSRESGCSGGGSGRGSVRRNVDRSSQYIDITWQLHGMWALQRLDRDGEEKRGTRKHDLHAVESRVERVELLRRRRRSTLCSVGVYILHVLGTML